MPPAQYNQATPHPVLVRVHRALRRTGVPSHIPDELAREALGTWADARREAGKSTRPTWGIDRWSEVINPSDPEKVRQVILIELSQWAREQSDAREVLEQLITWNHRLGVWCACAVAQSVLHLVPEGEERPARALAVARAWVCGNATAEDCRRAANTAAYAAARYPTLSAYAAVNAATDATYAAYAASTAHAAHAAAAMAMGGGDRASALRTLCGTVADALLTLPAQSKV